jgi:hypothetical protein
MKNNQFYPLYTYTIIRLFDYRAVRELYPHTIYARRLLGLLDLYHSFVRLSGSARIAVSYT